MLILTIGANNIVEIATVAPAHADIPSGSLVATDNLFHRDLPGSILIGGEINEDGIYTSLEYRPQPLVPGKWKSNGTEWINEAPDMEANIRLTKLRQDRNKLLETSDWTQLPDSPLEPSLQLAWKKWRQDVRNIPNNYKTYEEMKAALEQLTVSKPTK